MKVYQIGVEKHILNSTVKKNIFGYGPEGCRFKSYRVHQCFEFEKPCSRCRKQGFLFKKI